MPRQEKQPVTGEFLSAQSCFELPPVHSAAQETQYVFSSNHNGRPPARFIHERGDRWITGLPNLFEECAQIDFYKVEVERKKKSPRHVNWAAVEVALIKWSKNVWTKINICSPNVQLFNSSSAEKCQNDWNHSINMKKKHSNGCTKALTMNINVHGSQPSWGTFVALHTLCIAFHFLPSLYCWLVKNTGNSWKETNMFNSLFSMTLKSSI